MAVRKGDNSYINPITGGVKAYVLYFVGVDDEEFVLPIPPSQVSISIPERTSVTQTLAGIHADDYGEGITTIAIAGSFGVGVNPTNNKTGKQTMAKLNLFRMNRANLVKENDPDAYPIKFVDNQRGCVFICVNPEFHMDQSQQSPIKITYQMTFQVIRTQKLFAGLGDRTPIYITHGSATIGLPPKANNPVAINTPDPPIVPPVVSIIHPAVVAEKNAPNIVTTVINDIGSIVLSANSNLPSTSTLNDRRLFYDVTKEIAFIISRTMAGVSPDEKLLFQRKMTVAKGQVEAYGRLLANDKNYINLLTPISTIINSVSKEIDVRIQDGLPNLSIGPAIATIPSLPFQAETIFPAVEQYSLSQLSQAVYGSSDKPYLDAIRGANKLIRTSDNYPQRIPFLRVPDRDTLVDAPFDGLMY